MQRLQRKVAVGANHDPLEREADRMADHPVGAASHRGGGDDVEERFAAPASVEQVLATPGTPLDARLSIEMGQRFGHDFARVRVHAGDAAARSAQDVNALAYTVGHHVVFGTQMYQPATTEGRGLIAHELAHVVQQSGSRASGAAPAQPVVQRTIPDNTNRRHLTASEVRRSPDRVRLGVEDGKRDHFRGWSDDAGRLRPNRSEPHLLPVRQHQDATDDP
jgi:Domain of unknown function (DUF4157)